MVRSQHNIILYTVIFSLLVAILVSSMLVKNEVKSGRVNVEESSYAVPHTPNKELKTYTKSTFIQFLLSRIQKANSTTIEKREKLITFYKNWKTNVKLTSTQTSWLKTLARNYDISNFSVKQPSDWQVLLKRVDIVPAGLVLAQAINESAWGQSRFAEQGNNFFGQYCYVYGCGMIPHNRPYGATFEIKRFPNALAAVQGYMHNLNTNDNYRNFRVQRSQLRKEHRPLSSVILADALQNYSTRGEGYVNSLNDLISKFKLSQYD